MLIAFQDRPSDSPLVDRVWCSHSDRAGEFHSMATSNRVMVVTRHRGKIFLTVRGPETKASVAECPAEGDWVGIHFKIGTFIPLLETADLRDRNDLTLPGASGRAFLLDGSSWEYPTFENADTFVKRLEHRGLIARDPVVAAALQGQTRGISSRTEERHFRRATGLTRIAIHQIERARRATYLLRQGDAPAQVAYDVGFVDQAHMTRSLTRFIGQTPGQIARGCGQLSLLYNSREP